MVTNEGLVDETDKLDDDTADVLAREARAAKKATAMEKME